MKMTKAQILIGMVEDVVNEWEEAEKKEKQWFIDKYGKEKGMEMYNRHEKEECEGGDDDKKDKD